MSNIIAISIAALFLLFYMITSSIEFGSTLFLVSPRLLGENEIRSYINPIWETTNVFLVFVVVCLFAFFPGSISFFGRDLLWPVALFLIISGIRVAGVLLYYYGGFRPGLIRGLLFITSFLVPMVLAQFVVYVLTGTVVLHGGSYAVSSAVSLVSSTSFAVGSLGATAALGSALALFAGTTTLAISTAFFQFFVAARPKVGQKASSAIGLTADQMADQNVKQEPELQIDALRFVADISGLVFTFAIAVLLFAAERFAPHLFADPAKVTLAGTVLVICLLLAIFFWRLRRPLLYFFGSCLATAGITFALFYLNLPYLVYPNVTIYSSWTDPAVVPALFTSFVVGIIVIIPSFFLLFRLFVVGRKSE